MSGLATSCIAAVLGTCTLSAFAATATFDGGAGGYDTYSGTAGGGWQNGWVITQGSGGAGTATLGSTTPLSTGSGNYLTYSNASVASSSAAALSRQLSTADAIYAGHYSISFDIRADVIAPDNPSLVIASNTASVYTASDVNSAFQITLAVSGGKYYWNIYNGNNLGSSDKTAYGIAGVINTLKEVTAGTVYHFVIDVDPATNSFDVSINGTDYDVNTSTERFTFRCLPTAGTQQSFLSFKEFDSGAISLDNIAIAAIPEPTSFGLLALPALFLLKRK